MNKTALLMIVFGLTLQAAADERAAPIAQNCTEEDRDVRSVFRQQPYYPHSASMFCLTGEVLAEFTIDSRGTPRDIRIVDSQPTSIFDQAAIDAIEQWRFEPACRDGEPADRDATQTIMFELSPEARARCADRHGRLDDRSLELISEVGARYALLAQHARGQVAWPDIEPVLDAPFAAFNGNLGRVAAFHRQVFTSQAPTPRTRRLTELGGQLGQALQPDAIADDPSLDTAQRQLSAFRVAVDAWLKQNQATYADLSAQYQRLKRDSGLDPSTLDLLVTAFTGPFDAAFDEVAAPQLETLERAQAIVDFLDSRRSDWQATGEAVEFDRESDARVWESLWDDLIEHENELHSEHLAFLRSFDDYEL